MLRRLRVAGFNLKASTALSHTTVSVSAIASSLYGLYQVRLRLAADCEVQGLH